MLWNGVLVGWVGQLTRWTINMYTWTDCKPGFFFYEFAAQYSSMLLVQGLSVPFACVGSGDPVRVLHLYTTNTLDIL